MKVLVNKDYFVWREDSRNADAVKWLDRFLVRVFKAADKESAPRVKKGIGSRLARTVQEYEMGGRKYRVYAKYVVIDGETTFCAAAWHHKNVNKGQNSYIEAAEKMFESFDPAQWAAWQPSAQQLTEYSADDNVDADEEAKSAATAEPVMDSASKWAMQAQRTATRRAAKEEKQPKKSNKKRASATVEAAPAPVAETPVATPAAEAPVATPVAEAPVATPVAEVPVVEPVAEAPVATPVAEAPVVDMVAHTPIETPVKNQVNAPAEPQVVAPVEPVAPTAPATPVAPAAANDVPEDDVSDGQVRVLGTASQPAAARPAKPKQVVVAVEFRDVMGEHYRLEDVHYQLEVVKLRMEIERLEIEATDHRIALKKLELEKLKLQQMLKTKEAQK